MDALFHWPAEIRGLGPREIGPFTECERKRCQVWSFSRYGGRVLCLTHARLAARERAT